MSLIGVAAAVLACLGYGVASVLQASGARASAAAAPDALHAGTRGPTVRSTVRAALTPAFIAGIGLDIVGFVGSIVAARLIPLFLSQTIISANLVVTAVIGVAVLGVTLTTRDRVAIVIVVVSLIVLGLTAGDRGERTAHASVHWALLAITAVALAGGIGLVRCLGARAAVAAGLVAGGLYGAMAVGVRVVDGLTPLRVSVMLADPAFWTVVIAGLGGFYLFTVALQLGSVNGAAAALVVGETVVPGVTGVLLLGDSAQPGLGGLVAVAFATAVAGAVAVAVFGAAEPPVLPSHSGRLTPRRTVGRLDAAPKPRTGHPRNTDS